MDSDGNVSFKFEEYSIGQSELGCQFLFQSQFYEQYFLNILRDFNDGTDFFYVSFKKIRKGEFDKVGGFLTFLLIFVIILFALLCIFIIYTCILRCRKNAASSEKSPKLDSKDDEYEKINA